MTPSYRLALLVLRSGSGARSRYCFDWNAIELQTFYNNKTGPPSLISVLTSQFSNKSKFPRKTKSPKVQNSPKKQIYIWNPLCYEKGFLFSNLSQLIRVCLLRCFIYQFPISSLLTFNEHFHSIILEWGTFTGSFKYMDLSHFVTFDVI